VCAEHLADIDASLAMGRKVHPLGGDGLSIETSQGEIHVGLVGRVVDQDQGAGEPIAFYKQGNDQRHHRFRIS
jgi:hypothetical protein